MREREIKGILDTTGAYQQGHFELSSGLHSGVYLQCARLLQDPVISGRLCAALAEKFSADRPDIVIGPAMGGVIVAYETARALGARAIFTERDRAGDMVLRRGFIVPPGSRVLVAEDVLTTGKSVKEVIRLLKESGITPAGIASLVDRSAERIDFSGIIYKSLIKLSVPVFQEQDCPLCKEGLPLTKPGSRRG